MSLDFSILGLVILGVVILGVLCVGVVVVIRATDHQHKYLAKWDFLRAAEDTDEREQQPQRRDERILKVNDKIQQGDAQ